MNHDPTRLNIGTQKQLFIDDLVIESAENVCRTWHEPVRVSDKPLISKDQPWENIVLTHCNCWQIIRDPQDGLFKCWYIDLKLPDLKPGELVFGSSVFHILYAESDDGISWRKPVFDILPVDGQKTNIVAPHSYDLGLLFDTQESVPEKRFKMICTQHLPGQDSGEIIAAVSKDGIHWNILNELPVIGRHGAHLDDVIILHYDQHGRMYVMTTRHYDMYAVARNLNNPVTGTFGLPYYPLDWRRINKRRVWQTESADFIHWSEPYPILTPDEDDNLDETYGGMCRFQIGEVIIGFVNVISFVANTVEVRLAYSRDGRNWRHLNNRRQFMSLGGEGTWDAYLTTIPSKPLVMDDELWIYYGGSSCHHDWWITGQREGLDVPEAQDHSLAQMGIGLAKLRLDGFASLDAGYVRPGILITRPVISSGTYLIVNARCGSKGSIAAEIVDINDKVIPGFSRQECDTFTGDSVRHTFSWNGRKEIPVGPHTRAIYPEPERERFRKIRFFMREAALYSFTLE